MTSGTGIAVLDGVTHQRRESTSQDIENLVRIQQSLEHVDMVRSRSRDDYPADDSDLSSFITSLSIRQNLSFIGPSVLKTSLRLLRWDR
jgi:trimethylamine:corrinoid methyltransferase-like protein